MTTGEFLAAPKPKPQLPTEEEVFAKLNEYTKKKREDSYRPEQPEIEAPHFNDPLLAQMVGVYAVWSTIRSN